VPRKPNVLLLLTDDQGFDDLSCHGNPYLSTPHLDALASGSVQFANYCVASVCAPSRASLLTGRHFLRTGVAHVHGGKDFIHPQERLISQTFREAGYRTGTWGKWHSGKSSGYFPWERGFDEAYMAQLYKHHDSVGHFNGQPRSHQGWTVDTLVEYASDFMAECVQDHTPFLAYVSFLTVHAPLAGPERLVEKYRRMGLSEALATVYAMVEQTDAGVGRLLEQLDRLGIAEDTIVLFQSDNGPACLEGRLTDEDRRTRYVNGYKGHKGNMWENGIKSPLFVRWPGRFRPHTVDRLCDICDIYPTLADLCGIRLGSQHPPLDGRSFRAYLEGREDELEPKESFVWVSPGWPPDPEAGYSPAGRFGEYMPVAPEAKEDQPFDSQLVTVRGEQWKWLRNPGKVPGAPEPVDGEVLIHIREDPKEDVNLVADRSDQAQAMRRRARQWFEQIRQEPHAFHSPVFKIGPNMSNFVAAYAPTRVSGNVRNGGLSIYQFQSPGDRAQYDIEVTQAGRYRLHLDYVKDEAATIGLEISCGSAKIQSRLESPNGQDLGSLDLPAGKAALTMEVTLADRPDRPALQRMTTLRFDHDAPAR
jgi:uncharacterized sulfatase